MATRLKSKDKSATFVFIKKWWMDILALAFPCTEESAYVDLTSICQYIYHLLCIDIYFKTFHITWILASTPENIISSWFFLERLLSQLPSVSPDSVS